MLPVSLSASSAKVFEKCPSRWVAENFLKAQQPGGSAASLGTACHDALEKYVEKGLAQDPDATVEQLYDIFRDAYHDHFGDDDSRMDEGKEMLKTWYDRTHPIEHEILSWEVKENFPIRVNWNGQQVEVPFNYIWDRCDRLPNGDIDVVDYKTISFPLNADMMRATLQVRCYALAAKVKYPDAETIWVTYDMLRHGEPLGVSFSEDDLRATYKYLQNLLLRILNTPEENAPETVNDECRWCIRKTECDAIALHSKVGGIHGIDDPTVAANKRAKMDYAKKALDAAIRELDEVILGYMQKEDITDFDTDEVHVYAAARRRREVDASQVKRLVPDDLWAEYGGDNITMSQFDRLVKDDRLSPTDKRDLKALVRNNFSNPSVGTKPLDIEDED